MNGPGSSIGCKVFGRWWVPVTTLEHRFSAFEKFGNQVVQRLNDFVAMSHRKRTTRTKIILYVDYD
jgi:hypothetical protein